MQDLPIDDQIKLMRQKATENRGKFSNERRRQAANAYDRYADLLVSQQQKPAADTADLVPLTSQEVFDMQHARRCLCKDNCLQKVIEKLRSCLGSLPRDF